MKHSARIVGTRLLANAMHATSPAAHTKSGIAVCHSRSCLMSDRRPHQIIATHPNANGTEFTSPVCRLLSPELLMICGCHNVSP